MIGRNRRVIENQYQIVAITQPANRDADWVRYAILAAGLAGTLFFFESFFGRYGWRVLAGG